MPIYEYACDLCGCKLEKLQKISEAPLVDCPECEKPGLRKLVSAVAFRLKGGGWYETDFKDEKSRKNVAKDEDKRDAGADQAGDKKDAAEKKTAAKDGKETTADSASKDVVEKKAKPGANAVKSTAPAAKGAPAPAKH